MNKSRNLFSTSGIGTRLFIAGTILIVIATAIFVSGSAQESKQLAQPSTVAPGALAERASEPKLAPVKEESEIPEARPRQQEANPLGQIDAPATIEVASASNYVFSTTTGVALEDLSTGATQVIGTGDDDTASPAFNFGFDFYFMGLGYTQGSASPDGFLRLGPGTAADQFTNALTSTTNIPKLAPHWNDLATGSTGNVRVKVFGTAPNRKLVVQWFVTVPRVTGGAANATFQAWLFETTGVIQYVYGAVGTDTFDSGYSVGFTNSATQFASVTTSTNTNSFAAATDTNTAAIAAGRSYIYTPPAIAGSAPAGLNFTAIAPTSVTLNWTDNSTNEAGFPIYISSDGGTTYSLLAVAPENATSANITGLVPSTTYFFRVYAVTEGSITLTFTQNSFITSAPGNVASTAAGGLWSAPATWVSGVVPTAADNVTIADGATVTIDVAANAFSLTVGTGGAAATLQYETTTARTLTVVTNVTIAANGVFQSAATGTVTTHVLSIGGNLTNNGVLDFSTNANTAAAGITFTTAPNATFGGTGATTDIRTITVNKGTSFNSILELTASNFTVRGVNTDVAGFLTLTNGTFKLSGTFTGTNRVFTSATYSIGATTGFWLNNPNYTVVGQAGGSSTSNNGLLRISQGIFGVGVGAGDQMRGGAGAVFIIEGTGTLNCSGAFDPQNAISYTQTGGTVNVGIVGNNVSLFGTFEIFSSGASFTMSGGTINVIRPSTGTTKVDYDILAASVNITGGTVVIGAAPAPLGSTYNIQGWTPNLTINTGMNVVITTNASSTFPLLIGGTSFVNNGAVTGASAPFVDFATSIGPGTYSGTGTLGTLATPVSAIGADGFPFTLNAPIVTLRVNLFQGGFINSNQITLGNGGASATVVQVGFSGSPVPGGTFDVSPVHNQGTGGETVLYAQTTPAYTTGFEINPTRTLTALTVLNPNNVNLSGGDLTVTGAMTLTSGIFNTGANTLTHNGAATRTTGYVVGNLNRSYAVAGAYTYFVGTANSYSPVAANVTALTAGSTLTVKATQGAHPSLDATKSIQRYWTLTEGGTLTADLTFTYAADAIDVPVTSNEANYRLIRIEGGVAVNIPPPTATVNPATNTATITGVSNFSDWTVGEPVAPTAATANVGGHILTKENAPVSGVTMTLLDTVTLENRTAVTDANGFYQFPDISVGRDYVVTPARNGYGFNPPSRAFSHTGVVNNMDFTATPDGTQTRRVAGDYDGDGKTDLAVWRPSSGTWYIMQSSTGVMRADQWGTTGDRIVPADYDGDGKTDIAVFRPSNGTWYIYQSTTNSLRGVQWGVSDDVATPADFDGDGKADIAVWRASTGTWYILESTTGQVRSVNWGTVGDDPVAADYDNDGRADLAVFRPSNATWYIINSSNDQNRYEHWGIETDHPVVGDYDADGRADLAVFRSETATWYVKLSTDGSVSAQTHGASADRLVPGDYDGDGKTDRAVWQTGDGHWLILRSTTNATSDQTWGTNGDVPAPSAFVP